MAITNGYSTLARFKAQYLANAPTNAADDAVIEIFIESASRFIDQEVWPRTFYTRSETHYFDLPKEARVLYFHDYLNTTSGATLTNGDGTTISSSNLKYYPINERASAPLFKVEILPSASLTFVAASNGNTQRCISLAGTWGYASSTPLDIEQACMELAYNGYRRREGVQVDPITRITTGGVLIQANDINSFVMRVLNRYPRELGVD